MTAADRLNEIEARANAAREVPWEWHVTEDRRWTYVTGANGTVIEHMADDDDADFIAHARTDVPWLIEQVRKRDAALQAVLDLHVATEGYLCDGAVCLECTTFGDVEVPLPCATVRAIEEALT